MIWLASSVVIEFHAGRVVFASLGYKVGICAQAQ